MGCRSKCCYDRSGDCRSGLPEGCGREVSGQRSPAGGLSWIAIMVFVFYMFEMRTFLSGRVSSIWIQWLLFTAITMGLVLAARVVVGLLKRYQSRNPK